MEHEFIIVARGLLYDAAFFWRLAHHSATEADREARGPREDRASRNARAAFALIALAKARADEK